jgi:hypothetical protein
MHQRKADGRHRKPRRSSGSRCPPDDGEDARSLEIQRALGDEHEYGFQSPPDSGADTPSREHTDDRMIVRSPDAEGRVRAGSTQTPDPDAIDRAPAKDGGKK